MDQSPYWLYLSLQLATGVCYLIIPAIKRPVPDLILGIPWSAYRAFIWFCGLHHMSCLTMIVDMNGHVGMMYSGGLGQFRMAVDVMMTGLSILAVTLMLRHEETRYA